MHWKTRNSFLIWQQNDFDGQTAGRRPRLCGQLTGDLMSDRPFKQPRLTLISKSPTWSSISTPHNPARSIPNHSYAVHPLNKTQMLQNYQISTPPASENRKVLPPWLVLKCNCLFADEDIHFAPRRAVEFQSVASHVFLKGLGQASKGKHPGKSSWGFSLKEDPEREQGFFLRLLSLGTLRGSQCQEPVHYSKGGASEIEGPRGRAAFSGLQ